jgi:hypothetical protein
MEEKIEKLIRTMDKTNIKLAYQLSKSQKINIKEIIIKIFSSILPSDYITSIDNENSITEKYMLDILELIRYKYYKLTINYPTENYQGFIQSEIEKLLSFYPDVNMEKFNDSLMGNTCMLTKEGNIIAYHYDIAKALGEGLKK